MINFEDCEVCYATVDKGTLNDVQAGRICNECHKMNQYEGGTKTIKTPYNAETFEMQPMDKEAMEHFRRRLKQMREMPQEEKDRRKKLAMKDREAYLERKRKGAESFEVETSSKGFLRENLPDSKKEKLRDLKEDLEYRKFVLSQFKKLEASLMPFTTGMVGHLPKLEDKMLDDLYFVKQNINHYTQLVAETQERIKNVEVKNAETFEAEGKKRSGLLSEPFEGTSLDSGDWKGILTGFGIGLLGLFGYSKLRK